MLNGFFKQSLHAIKGHQATIEKIAFLMSGATSLFFYPEFSKQYTQMHLLMLFNQLPNEEKLAIKNNPNLKHDMLEKSQAHLTYMLGRPD